MKLKALLAAVALLVAGALATEARADQGSLCQPTTGTVSGLALSQNINASLQALVTANSGASAPVNACAGVEQTGQFWLDTSASPALLKIWDSAAWETIGVLDAATGRWTPPLGGGANSVASATTADLWSVPQSYVNVTGTATITGFGGTTGPVGSLKVVNFVSAAVITYNATSLIIPGSTSVTAQAGDKAAVVNLGGGNTAIVAYTRRDGTAIAPSSVFSGAVAFTGAITASGLSGTTNNWAPSGLASAAVIRASAASNATITGLTAQPSGTLLFLENVGTTTTITLTNEASGSTAANRFTLGADLTINAAAGVLLRYDGTLLRWVVMASHYRLATTALADTGTDNTTIMTPFLVAREIQTGYRLTGLQQITASGTYTPTAGTRLIVAQCIAGGGGGGSATVTSGIAGGGGGGQGAVIMYVGAPPSPSAAVTIGTAGAAASAGAQTSLGSLCVAKGGQPGANQFNGTTIFQTAQGGAGGDPATSTGTIKIGGENGGWEFGVGASGQNFCSGGAGGGPQAGLGGVTNADSGNANGATAVWYGSGGGGGCATVGGGTGTGGSGKAGIVQIWEYN